MPNQDWTCDVRASEYNGIIFDETISMESPVFKAMISSLGRDAYCGQSPDSDGIAICENFYQSSHFSMVAMKNDGIIQEIYGTTDQEVYSNGEPEGWVWISIQYKATDVREITEAEKAELYQLLNSITFSEPGK